MRRILVIVPVPIDDEGMAHRREQALAGEPYADLEIDYRPVRVGSKYLDSHQDALLTDVGVVDAAAAAEQEGYDAVCIDTTSDSGMNALRSLLRIPVIGAGRVSLYAALMLGPTFSILTQWDGWIPDHWQSVRECGLQDRCVSVRSINVEPDLRNLYTGKLAEITARLIDEGMKCVADGADVICFGSTSMHQAHAEVARALPVPVINPGPLSYKLAESFLALGLTHSKHAFADPSVRQVDVIEAMASAGRDAQDSVR